jgi:hypothetical protein
MLGKGPSQKLAPLGPMDGILLQYFLPDDLADDAIQGDLRS